MHLGILARVSTEEQRKGQTIQAQISELENYAKQNNLTIVDRFLDEGWSGTLEHRPALDRMNESIMSGAIDTVLMYHPDRLSRDSVQQLLLQREYEKQHITLIFTSQPNLHDQSPEVRLIQKTIIAMTSELDKMRITDRFRIGKLRKVRSGHHF
jgi:site-specific DNA recombinase